MTFETGKTGLDYDFSIAIFSWHPRHFNVVFFFVRSWGLYVKAPNFKQNKTFQCDKTETYHNYHWSAVPTALSLIPVSNIPPAKGIGCSIQLGTFFLTTKYQKEESLIIIHFSFFPLAESPPRDPQITAYKWLITWKIFTQEVAITHGWFSDETWH